MIECCSVYLPDVLQNVSNTGLADRFEEYPKLKELIRLKVWHCF